MLIVDAHEDLAWNIRSFQRDYTRSAAETRAQERNTPIPGYNGNTLLGWPDYQRGQIGVVFATLFAAPQRGRLGDWDTQAYDTYDQARSLYMAQLDAYHRLAEDHPDKFRLILEKSDLEAVLSAWRANPLPQPEQPEAEEQFSRDGRGREESPEPAGNPVGITILMEGAEGVRDPAELEEWWGRGVRIIGPAWTGTRFCGGTREPGPLTKEGYALLEGMASFGFSLDISHMDEKAVLQALDTYPGRIIASHANVAHLYAAGRSLESNRFLSDKVIHGLLERDAIIGVVPYNRFLDRVWKPAEGKQAVSLRKVAEHIDTICQRAGDANHAGLGSDFDGGFGWEATPAEIDTVADLQKLTPILEEMGYTQKDIAAILGENWISFLQQTLPETA